MDVDVVIPGWVVAVPLLFIVVGGIGLVFKFARTERARTGGMVAVLALMGLYYLAWEPFRYDPAQEAPKGPPVVSPAVGDGVPA